MKRKHPVAGPVEPVSTGTVDTSDHEWDCEPDIQVCVPDREEGRTVRKRTSPQPVLAPKRKRPETEFPTRSDVGQNHCTEQEIQAAAEVRDFSVQTEDTEIHRCIHCGIVFEDIAMFCVHMGCHSLNSPFQCNVCGEKCQDKMRFLIHLTRGHH